MTARYFVQPPVASNTVVLADAEAHHLLHVMRGRVGDEVLVVDGSGQEFTACVQKLQRRTVELEVLKTTAVDREAPWAITMGVALPKGDRQRWLIEKATELGVASVVPLSTARGVAQPTDKALERLRRGVIEATKQCGRTRLMEVCEAAPLSEFLHQPGADVLRLCAHPDQAQPLRQLTDELPTVPDRRSVFLAVGPEGGFAPDEFAEATACGWHAVSLGPRILRIETACLSLVSAVLSRVE